MVTWKNVGFYVIIYLAGLQYIPRSCKEAIEMEARAQAFCMETRDFHRAYEAFASKKIPEFQGN